MNKPFCHSPNAASGAPFDLAAHDYDAIFTHTAIGTAQRQQVWQILDRVCQQLGRPLHILELNCGTGEDAIHMAQAGHMVYATDVAPNMVKLAKKKVQQHALTSNIQVARLSINEIANTANSLQAAFPSAPAGFDIVFSNFAGLNCVQASTLMQLSTQLYARTAPECHMLFVIMPRFCLWETLWYSLRLKPRSAMQRWRSKAVIAHVSGASFPIWYYTPRDITKYFAAHFQTRQYHPIGLAVPPSTMAAHFENKRLNLLKRLQRFDIACNNISALAHIADHALVHLVRSPS